MKLIGHKQICKNSVCGDKMKIDKQKAERRFEKFEKMRFVDFMFAVFDGNTCILYH